MLDGGNPWTLVMMPDTQFYSERQDWTDEYFRPQTQWVRDHKTSDNIRFLTHVGDVVQHGSSTTEWQRADSAMDLLNGIVPYSVTAGNHDYDADNNHASANNFKTYFGSSRYAGQSWYGGSSPDQLNHYQIFQAEGRTYLHLNVEWQPRASSVAWIQSVIDAHPTLPMILTTHSYLNTSGHSNDTVGTGYLSGAQMYQQIVRPNPQIFLTFNGHYTGERNQTSMNDENLPVLEVLADYQGYAEGGQGYMRLLKFVPQSDRIEVKSYSPGLNAYYTDSNSQFNMPLDFDRRLVFTPVGTFVGDNGGSDSNPAENAVTLATAPAAFEVKLSDIDGGIRDSSVTSSTVALLKNGVTQSASSHYTFSYNASTDTVRLASRTGTFGSGAYQIRLSSGSAKIADARNLNMVSQTLNVQVNSGGGGGGSVTRTFQEGVAGYAGTSDTFLRQAAPTTSYATATSLNVDNAEDSAGNDAQALLQFKSIFGSGANQIPPGAQITSARLELNVTNPGNALSFHRMISGWHEGRTWSSQGNGVTANDGEAKATADVVTGAVPTGILSVDVATSIRAWQSSPSTAQGWAILPTGSDGVDFHSEQDTVKPKLIVTYTIPTPSSMMMAASPPEGEESPTAAQEADAQESPAPAAAAASEVSNDDEARREVAEPEQSPVARRRPTRPREEANDQAIEEMFAA